jgi:hypothetical protein
MTLQCVIAKFLWKVLTTYQPQLSTQILYLITAGVFWGLMLFVWFFFKLAIWNGFHCLINEGLKVQKRTV